MSEQKTISPVRQARADALEGYADGGHGRFVDLNAGYTGEVPAAYDLGMTRGQLDQAANDLVAQGRATVTAEGRRVVLRLNDDDDADKERPPAA